MQAVGRAIRLTEDKKIGTIVIPVFIDTAEEAEVALEGSAFKPVWDVVKALRAHDDLLGEQLDELRRDRGRQTKAPRLPAKIIVDLPARISADFASAFDIHLVDETTASWEFFFGLLLGFVEREGHARVPQRPKNDFKGLGSWVSHARAAYGRGILPGERIARLEALPGWVWDANDAKWEDWFDRLRAFVEREGHARVPDSYRFDGHLLGRWVNWQRVYHSRSEMTAERTARLEAVDGWTWDAWTARREDGFDRLRAFVEREGHTNVPGHYREDGFDLGGWVRNWRARYAQGKVPPDRIAQFEAFPGWSWERPQTGKRPLKGENPA